MFSTSVFGGTTQNRTGDQGVAVPRLTAWLWYHVERLTRLELAYLHLGKVALYQMSYSRIFSFSLTRFFDSKTGYLPLRRYISGRNRFAAAKAMAVETIHRIVSKSRLSIP